MALASAKSASQAVSAKPFAKNSVRIAVQADHHDVVGIRAAASMEGIQASSVLIQITAQVRWNNRDCRNVVVQNWHYIYPCSEGKGAWKKCKNRPLTMLRFRPIT